MPPGGTPLTDQDDPALITMCLAGREDAWTELVRRYSRLVYAIALKSGLDGDAAGDVVQDVFIIVLRRLESLRETERFSAWLITTTRRESWRARKQNREQALDDAIDPIDNDPTAAEQVIAWEEASTVHRALGMLGDRCQRLMRMLFLQDPRPSYESIASDLGISIGSIGPTRGRCLKQLRGHIEELGLTESPV
jgi:RNA polymerase sigma factor (sigma-70 family)